MMRYSAPALQAVLSMAAALLLLGPRAARAQHGPEGPAAQTATSSIAASTTAPEALAQIVVTGTRQSGVTAADSAAPVQVISGAALQAASGNPTLLSALSQLVPSFTEQPFGNDMAGQTLQAKLRGLSCNDVLVLVDGKRRHTTANIEVDAGPYQGCAGVDLGFIPIDAIARIEVLTDGAAAQYGSDAIAGVINIILKRNPSGGHLTGTYGGYLDGGGITGDVRGEAGFRPLAGSYFDVTGESHHHGASNRSAIDERVVNPANLATYPNSNMPNAAGYPYLGAEEGDGNYDLKTFAVNTGVPVGPAAQFYAFGTYGVKSAQSYQKYRLPNKVSYTDPATGIATYPFAFGFVPLEASGETDYSGTAGLKGVLAKWLWDLSSTYGRDLFDAYTLNSANAGVYAATGHPTPLNYYDGYLQSTQWTSNLDVNRNLEVGLAGPLNVAYGFEYRRDSYGIGAGVPLSYLDGGAQAYPGFTPTDAGIHYRHVGSVYVDLAAEPVRALTIDVAGRYEHYSDFGSATVGKLTARYDFTPHFALRGTVSSGFRAPTLAEEYYSSTNVTPTSAFVQLPPNSAGGRLVGLGSGLRPEHSVNLSAGVVWRPLPSVIGTLDVYQINITDRIVDTGNLYGTLNGVAQASAPAINAAIAANGNQLDPSVLATGTTGINIFANGPDTSTQGADLVFDFPQDFALGHIDWSVGATYNHTVITKVPSGPAELGGQALFDATAISDLSQANPLYVINLGGVWVREKLTVHLEEQIYGPSSEWESDGGDNPQNVPLYFQTTVGAAPITNLDVAYRFTAHVTLSAGAENLLDRYPDKYNSTLLAHYDTFRYGDTLGVFQYPMFSPFGINGGFYYLRGTVRF